MSLAGSSRSGLDSSEVTTDRKSSVRSTQHSNTILIVNLFFLLSHFRLPLPVLCKCFVFVQV